MRKRERERERERNTRARARGVHMCVCITSDIGEQFLSGSRVETELELELTTPHDIAYGKPIAARFRVQETKVRRSSTPDGRRAHFGNIPPRDRSTSTSRYTASQRLTEGILNCEKDACSQRLRSYCS